MPGEVRGRLSKRAGRGWDRWMRTYEVNAAAICEALGLRAADGWEPPDELLELARKVQEERSARS